MANDEQEPIDEEAHCADGISIRLYSTAITAKHQQQH